MRVIRLISNVPRYYFYIIQESNNLNHLYIYFNGLFSFLTTCNHIEAAHYYWFLHSYITFGRRECLNALHCKYGTWREASVFPVILSYIIFLQVN